MSTTAVKNTLGKHEKLKSRKQIDGLFANAQAFTAFPVKVIFTITDSVADGAPVQIGVTASARNFKHAADRNRIKRLLREAYRLQKQELTAAAAAKDATRRAPLQRHLQCPSLSAPAPRSAETAPAAAPYCIAARQRSMMVILLFGTAIGCGKDSQMNCICQMFGQGNKP